MAINGHKGSSWLYWHIYCNNCINDYVAASPKKGFSGKCPDCRATFRLIASDPSDLPEEYHPFFVSSVRRVYIENNNEDRDKLEHKVKHLKERLAAKIDNEKILTERCDSFATTIASHQKGEREAKYKAMDFVLKNDFLEVVMDACRRELRESRKMVEEPKSRTRYWGNM
ncbi:hypothetical protein CPB83DRAFT_921997 [Crepidotus variabilis]|uniref:Uncharacterized protein n=1 Tax=Crepidotus variabilis TaxID=179855 RepID=A0A9P6EJQ8_9AGAR|nr:hypothetical protein CPB83DRAFT_921997 [Crepidotus variabilis]